MSPHSGPVYSLERILFSSLEALVYNLNEKERPKDWRLTVFATSELLPPVFVGFIADKCSSSVLFNLPPYTTVQLRTEEGYGMSVEFYLLLPKSNQLPYRTNAEEEPV